MTPNFAPLRQKSFGEFRRVSDGRLHVDYKLNAINRLNQLFESLVRVDFARYILRAVTENQLLDFQRDFGVVHECGACVASVVQ